MRNFSKLNSSLKSANTLKALLKNVLSYNLMTASARFLMYWLSLMRYSTLKSSSFMQTCQVSVLGMSEKFVKPPKNFPNVARKILFWPSRGSGGMFPQKILKIMYPRLAKIAYHGISAVKIKCHLTILHFL